MQLITADLAPPPGGHYSQAVVAAGLVFLAGQLPIRLEGGIPEGAAAQTRQALSNVATILEAAGSGLDRVVSATVYVTDIADWPIVNSVYSEVFGDHKPARTVTVSPKLHYGALIEIQIIALGAPLQ